MVERLVFRTPVLLLSTLEDTDRPILKPTQADRATIATTRGRRRFRLVGAMETIQQLVKPPISSNPKPFNRTHICFPKITSFLLSLSTRRNPLDHYLNIIDCGCGTLAITPQPSELGIAFSVAQKFLASLWIF